MLGAGLNATVLLALILISAPIRGLCPLRAARSHCASPQQAGPQDQAAVRWPARRPQGPKSACGSGPWRRGGYHACPGVPHGAAAALARLGGWLPVARGKRALKIPLLADDVRAFKCEVIRPLLGSRIKQRYERPCFRVKRANITPLPAIAQRAGQGEVVEYCLPSMLVGNHMVHLVCRGGKILMEQTVFTAIPCSLNYLTPEICCGPKCTSSTLL
jgi:hypothetical protein